MGQTSKELLTILEEREGLNAGESNCVLTLTGTYCQRWSG